VQYLKQKDYLYEDFVRENNHSHDDGVGEVKEPKEEKNY